MILVMHVFSQNLEVKITNIKKKSTRKTRNKKKEKT